MKRTILVAAALASLAFAAPTRTAEAATSIGVAIDIGDRYRGASLRFRSAPDVVLIPRSRVYYVRNYGHDLYRHGRYWYLIEDGRWYRSRSYRGPFIHIRFRDVPRAISGVPFRYRRNWYGRSVAGRYYEGRDRWVRDDRYRDRDWDRDRDGRDRDGRWDRDRDGRDRDGQWDRDGRDRDAQDRDGQWERGRDRDGRDRDDRWDRDRG